MTTSECETINAKLYIINDVIGLEQFREKESVRKAILIETKSHMNDCNICKKELAGFLHNSNS